MSISIKNLTFSYEDEQIFTGFNLNIKEGKHTVLKGDSGSGKSTLLRLILGFLQPAGGEISLFDKPMDTRAFKELRQRAAWLPQDLNMGENTVRDMIYVPFSFKNNAASKPPESTVLDTFELLGLHEEVLDKQFTDLSTGQRQRVGISLCVLLDRPLLLLDEPTSALDRSSKEKAAELLLGNPDKTILSVSHDPFWVEKADMVIEL
jgi:ABC-type transport system involved in cytochrome bd biosynthesis fused ATPase/permease subunit